MFHEAVASLYSKQMGFQVLTSIAVIGASILGMWEEALMVVILGQLQDIENSALDNARELMQGGLDRIQEPLEILNPSIKLASPMQFNAFSVQSITPSIQPLEVTPHQHQKPTEEHEIISLDLVNVGDILEVRSGRCPCSWHNC